MNKTMLMKTRFLSGLVGVLALGALVAFGSPAQAQAPESCVDSIVALVRNGTPQHDILDGKSVATVNVIGDSASSEVDMHWTYYDSTDQEIPLTPPPSTTIGTNGSWSNSGTYFWEWNIDFHTKIWSYTSCPSAGYSAQYYYDMIGIIHLHTGGEVDHHTITPDAVSYKNGV